MGVRHEKDIMRQNRLFREQQYSERRQKDYEEALERERDLCVKAKSEYQAQTELQLLQHKEVLQLKADAKHRKNYAMCEDLVNQIVLLSFKVNRREPQHFQFVFYNTFFSHHKDLTVQGIEWQSRVT